MSPLHGLRQPKASYREGTLSALWDAELITVGEIEARLKENGYTLLAPSNRMNLYGALRFAVAAFCLLVLYGLVTHAQASAWLGAFPIARAGMSLGMLFVVGLFTSLHCVAMCGGINIAQSASAAKRGHRPAYASLMYNLGRVLSYTVIGGVVGALGMALQISDRMKAGLQIAAAVFMLLMALNLIGGFSWLRRLTLSLPSGLRERFVRMSAGRSSFFIGLTNGLMPCGPLQSMQLYALATGSWWMGALSMFSFSLGTVPLMLGFGVLGGRLNRKFARPMHVMSALLVAVMGMSMLSNGFALAGVSLGRIDMAADGVARIANGKQIVRTELDYGRYPAITVQAGIPVEWTIVAPEQKINGCNNELVIPAYGLRIALKPGENRIAFTPQDTGVLPYSCWMGMIRSGIDVVEGDAHG